MNRKFTLSLLSSPALFASMLSMVIMTQPAHANQTQDSSQTRLSCIQNPHSATPRMACVRVSKANAVMPKQQVNVPQQNYNPSDITEMDFSEEESDTAIALFGCDCPSCLNALRQMRGQAPMPV
ncbi:MAG: hypothetical protein N2235_21685 [Fischerella sp.]|nr:hypothetical protein [Fischerella sp.]